MSTKLNGKMKIGFDAKRAFFNHSGLGNYSRLIIDNIAKLSSAPIQAYTPRPKTLFYQPLNTEVVTPRGVSGLIPSVWRSKGIVKDLVKQGVDVYHGLSNELPIGIKDSGIKSVVTIHDLIFLRYPELYKSYDRKIYLKKTKHAVESADYVLAISEQTKRDLIEYLSVPEEKIVVHYQDCDAQFRMERSSEEIQGVKVKYNLPDDYVLSVGTIEPRKNQLLTLKAAHKVGVPVVFIGRKTEYYKELESYVLENNLQDQVFFPEKVSFSDFPALYQGAKVFMYPSIFEGFGIPILEALRSKIPVITSKGSCFEETGGDAALYIDNELSSTVSVLSNLLNDSDLSGCCVEKGLEHAKNFDVEKTMPQLLQLYKEIVG